MEPLLAQADNLNREVALLSNTLHQYRDDDVAGARSVIEKILQGRKKWRECMARIEVYQKTGKLPEERKVPEPTVQTSGTISELKVELARINTLISKLRKKLELTPEHKKADAWGEELARMEALKKDISTKIIELKYATT